MNTKQYSDTANIGLEDNLHRKAYKEDYCRVQERMEDEHEEEQYFAEGVETDGAMQRGLNKEECFTVNKAHESTPVADKVSNEDRLDR